MYLAADLLLLASVFEAFRKLCYETYGLDCACYFFARNLSGDAFIKVCSADLKLLTEGSIWTWCKKNDSGRDVINIYTSVFKANNKNLEDYNPEGPSSYLLKKDAIKLYGGIMKHCPLPMNDFSIVVESFEGFLKTEGDTEWGYVLEVDLSIPEEIQDYFADYPLAPSGEVIGMVKQSNEQIQMLGEMGVTSLPKGTKTGSNIRSKGRVRSALPYVKTLYRSRRKSYQIY